MRPSDKLIKAMQDAGFLKSNTEIIIDIIWFWMMVGILAGAFVLFFSLSWGKALLISWMFNFFIGRLGK